MLYNFLIKLVPKVKDLGKFSVAKLVDSVLFTYLKHFTHVHGKSGSEVRINENSLNTLL